ncbi:alpha/beta-hydrolase [Pholiota conissans]|uniref:Alpha/beta-hydrolase n=1 Tax=Pholiota conissans TaxID=109636 RepID=A0A9P6CUQ2_9AGAR|nr:alpha/beta-hydrolase [Pholiota conissans]
MNTLAVTDVVTFHYTDSGPAEQNDYTTIVMVHGHSFHSGVFARILPLANLHGFRIICVSRRGYVSSTPYTPEEKQMIETESAEEHDAFLSSQGVLLALFVDGIIHKYSLPEAGGVALLGWSMGNVFTLAALSAVHDVPKDARERLQRYLHTYICWDAANVIFGIAIPEIAYFPLLDPSLSPEERIAAFKIWVSGYFQHGAEFSQINQRDFDTIRKPTMTVMTEEEANSVFDGLHGAEFDTPLISIRNIDITFGKQAEKVLFDQDLRTELWPRLKISFMYAEQSIWLVVVAMRELEGRAKQSGIYYDAMDNANHFMMWDEPERFMLALKKIILRSELRTEALDLSPSA